MAHDKKSPFVVKTPMAQVKVLGTRFDVKALPATGHFEAALMEGKIELSRNDDPDHSYVLYPDMSVTLCDNIFITRAIDDTGKYLWKEGLISFSESPFEDILSELGHCFDKEVILSGDVSGKACYSGKFRIDDGMDYALRVLQRDLGFSFEYNADTNTIHIK
ncbi:MAG: DUF4974 domain-containing protein [Alistipes sp.]|nr:DUF4974 domain-containing protein [Alistipes sp.]